MRISFPRIIRKELLSAWTAISGMRGPFFECPLCRYQGRFRQVVSSGGRRKFAQCPQCGALERHRLQFLVIDSLLKELPVSSMEMLHVAPESFFISYFRQRFRRYDSADLSREDVDHKVDLTALPFREASYDFVFASHVLEHIRDDLGALAEIRRILKPGGIAVLPVPLLGKLTVEYPEPNPAEAFHVRAPGYEDYFDRYRKVFNRVEVVTSDMLPEKYQLYVYEDRSSYPNRACPRRLAMPGKRHIDAVPVCYV